MKYIYSMNFLLYTSSKKLYRSVPSHLSFTRIGQAPNKDLRLEKRFFYNTKNILQKLFYSNRLKTNQKLWNINICLSVVLKFLKFWNLRKGRNPGEIPAKSRRNPAEIPSKSVRKLVQQEINCFCSIDFLYCLNKFKFFIWY